MLMVRTTGKIRDTLFLVKLILENDKHFENDKRSKVSSAADIHNLKKKIM